MTKIGISKFEQI